MPLLSRLAVQSSRTYGLILGNVKYAATVLTVGGGAGATGGVASINYGGGGAGGVLI